MIFAFFGLLALNCCGGVLAWLMWRRVIAHMRRNPEAAKLIAEHVIAPLLTGGKEPKDEDKREVKRIKGTLT